MLYDLRTTKEGLDKLATELNNESILNRLEELKEESQSEIPQEIISLLDTSNAANQAELIEHINSKALLGK